VAQRLSLDANDATLDRYFSQLQGLPLLSASQELALAREIEALEIQCWRALLSYEPAFDVIVTALEPGLQERAGQLEALRKLAQSQPARRGRSRAPTGDARRARAATLAAQRLRALDMDRSALNAAEAAVHAAFAGDAGARSYLASVARARNARHAAKNRFVSADLRLVISMARRCDRSLMPLADLIQEGNLGLMRAVDRFDYRRGFRFSTYAAWWIRHSLNRALSDKARLVRVPVHALDDLSRLSRASNLIAARNAAIPSVAELASQTGIPEDKLQLLRSAGLMKHPVSLDHGGLDDENEQTLHDTLPATDQYEPEPALDLASWRVHLKQLLDLLKPIEAAVLRFRFGLSDGNELTLNEIGQKYNLSRERIRQLQVEALAKLRKSLQSSLRSGDVESSAA
jgi:RNA polymerase primary sigma factor